MSLSIREIQNPSWIPIFSQEILCPEDQLKVHIKHPSKANPKDCYVARKGKVNTIEFNHFDEKSEALKSLKERFPFFY
ncbi:hypothetical protein [Candidatus Harpocratesius sp.]